MEAIDSTSSHIASKVLITAGNGTQANFVAPLLNRAGLHVRAMRASDRPGPGPLDFGAAEVTVGDASDPDDAARALDGITIVYHVGPTFHPREREMGFNMVEQAKRAGGRHFIFSSVLHPILTGLPQHAHKRDIEEHLIESGLNLRFSSLRTICRRRSKDIRPVSVYMPWAGTWTASNR